MQQIFVFLLSLLSVWIPASSYAQVKISDTGSGVKTIYFPSNVIGGTGSAYEIPAKITPSTDGGLVKGTALAVIKNPSGNPLALTATARAPAAAVGAAIGKFASKVVTPLAVGSALYDLGKELGYIFDNSSGQLVVLKESPLLVSDTGSLFYARDGTYQVASVAGQQQCTYFFNGTYVSASLVSGTSYAVTCRKPDGSVTSANPFGSYIAMNLYSGTVQPLPQNNSSSVDEFSTAVSAKTSWPSTSAISRTLQQAQDDYDIFLDYNPPTVTGPASTTGNTSVTTNSNNTTTTTTTTHNHTYEGAKVSTTNITTTTVKNTATGEPISTQTTTEAPSPQPEPVETCGLPGKPLCNVKVDETGVPDKTDLDPTAKTTEALKDIKEFATNPVSKLPTLPTLNWSFQLPSGCAALSIPGFAPFLQSIDVCQFTPMFHDIMSIVWLMGGLFGAISMFFRNTFATQ